jgi:hypothetical protein
LGPTIKVTAKQIRFLLGSGRAWMVQPLHVPDGVPKDLQGYYRVPLEEERHSPPRNHGLTIRGVVRLQSARLGVG